MMVSGDHTYELRLAGYQNKSGLFTVVPGYDMPVIISETLQPIPGAGGTAMIVGMVGIAALGMMMTYKPPTEMTHVKVGRVEFKV